MATEHPITKIQTVMAMVSQMQQKIAVVQEQLHVHQPIRMAMVFLTTWIQIQMAMVFQTALKMQHVQA